MSGFAWVVDWLHLLARWFHFTVGVAWIGASFYFVWLNNNVRRRDEDGEGVAGGLWAIHGGAFYEVVKLEGAPKELPPLLHWFKWEAYLTWLSGATLLVLVFWLNPSLMMVARDGPIGPGASVAVGIGSLVVAWLVYDLLCKSPLAKQPIALALVGAGLLAAAAYGLSLVLTPRAAYIHVGAMIGTMMAWNVFFVIIPGQRAMVDAMIEGREPPVERGKAGSLRSLHNNYFTLPVLFIMISNHFPFTYGYQVPWAVLAVLGLLSAGLKHWHNLHERGARAPWIPVVVALGVLALAFVVHGPPPAVDKKDVPSFAEVTRVIQLRCVSCHAEKPTQAGILEAPKGFKLDDPSLYPTQASLIHAQSVATETMPLGNLTGMTKEERALLGKWIAAGAPTE